MRTVVITGTNRGLGIEYVRRYAADGWCVFAACGHPDVRPKAFGYWLSVRKAWSRL